MEVFYHPKSSVAHKAFCSDQKAILNLSEKPEAKRVSAISQTEQKNPVQNTDDTVLLISPLFFFLKISNLNDSF